MTEWVFLTAAIMNLVTAMIDLGKKVREKKRSKKEDSRSDKRKSS
ncbi:hypothetical protein [Salimicrobium flavidum]|uniref:Uncharacterized protein n=1 Tax=Salimicrobium flavidum TaxID=570947 RepID=A0A1N7J9N9_9BACI|nr:hypothetical protein [Salimicrobium flavidum]SIS46045.1 hypothetical protein SAMN05421687_104227 [Salimicrobium flavidum]